jgi:hypothetical protein
MSKRTPSKTTEPSKPEFEGEVIAGPRAWFPRPRIDADEIARQWCLSEVEDGDAA